MPQGVGRTPSNGTPEWHAFNVRVQYMGRYGTHDHHLIVHNF